MGLGTDWARAFFAVPPGGGGGRGPPDGTSPVAQSLQPCLNWGAAGTVPVSQVFQPGLNWGFAGVGVLLGSTARQSGTYAGNVGTCPRCGSYGASAGALVFFWARGLLKASSKSTSSAMSPSSPTKWYTVGAPLGTGRLGPPAGGGGWSGSPFLLLRGALTCCFGNGCAGLIPVGTAVGGGGGGGGRGTDGAIN